MARCLLRGRRQASSEDTVLVIPDGESFDLARTLWENERVQIWTVDGITITIERNVDASVNHCRDVITGLFMTIEFMGSTKIAHNGWCQRYLSTWESIDPSREGLRWRFGDIVRRDKRERERELGAVCARTVHGL